MASSPEKNDYLRLSSAAVAAKAAIYLTRPCAARLPAKTSNVITSVLVTDCGSCLITGRERRRNVANESRRVGYVRDDVYLLPRRGGST